MDIVELIASTCVIDSLKGFTINLSYSNHRLRSPVKVAEIVNGNRQNDELATIM